MHNERPANLFAGTLSAQEQVWQALAAIARQLQFLTQCQTGEGNFFSPKPSPPIEAGQPRLLIEIINEFLLAKAQAGRCDRYLAALRLSLASFSRGRRKTLATAITVQEIERWLHSNGWAARTKKGYLGDVRTLFNFAFKRGYIARNPALAVELPVFDSLAPFIHSPKEVRAVLEFARRYDLNICRALAVRYFAGLRTAEVGRLEEKELGDNYLEVTAAKAKTRRRRLVAIQPVLRAWLKLGGELPAIATTSRRMIQFMQALKLSGAVWEHNVTRHSFVSYHLAQSQNAGKTALEAGHTEQMLFAHYRELVTPEAAAVYWNIFPSQV